MERGQQWRHLMDLWTEADLQRSSLSSAPHGFGETVTAVEKCLRHTHTSPGSPLHYPALPAPGAASAPEPVPARGTAATDTLELLLLLMHILNYTAYKLMDFNWLPMVAWGKLQNQSGLCTQVWRPWAEGVCYRVKAPTLLPAWPGCGTRRFWGQLTCTSAEP